MALVVDSARVATVVVTVDEVDVAAAVAHAVVVQRATRRSGSQ